MNTAAIGKRLAFDLLLTLLFVVLATITGTNLFFSSVRFDSERIEIWAAEEQIHMHGLYHYQNLTLLPVSVSLGLPFPVDSNHPAPSTFFVAQVDSRGKLMYPVSTRTYHGNNVFRLFFGPKQEKWIQIDYFQQTHTQDGKYILETTRKWNRPLDHGEYILHLGKGLALASSTYRLETYSTGDQSTYCFSRARFYPGEDWAFAWKQIAKPTVALRRR